MKRKILQHVSVTLNVFMQFTWSMYVQGIDTHSYVTRVPTRTGKPGKMGRHFPVREKSGNFEQTGKVREKSGKITQNTGKLREFEINII